MNPRHLRHTQCQKLFLFPQAVAQQKKKAELFYKERLWVYNYVMQKTKIIQKDYSLSSMNYQLKLPFEFVSSKRWQLFIFLYDQHIFF